MGKVVAARKSALNESVGNAALCSPIDFFLSLSMHRYQHREHCCALRRLTELRIHMCRINLLTSDLNPFCLLFQGGAGGLLHKREGPDALHQH